MGSLARSLVAAGLAAAALSCGGEQGRSGRGPEALLGSALVEGLEEPGCSFFRGVSTCVATAVTLEPSTHVEVSACVAFNGSQFVPGRRARTFLDQVQVFETTTTLRHGLHGSVFDVSSGRTTVLLSSTLVSDVCAPL